MFWVVVNRNGPFPRTLDLSVLLDVTDQSVSIQLMSFTTTKRSLDKVFKLSDVNKSIVVAFKDEAGVGAMPDSPFKAHEILESQVVIVIDKGSLDDITILVTFCLDKRLDVQLGGRIDSILLGKTE